MFTVHDYRLTLARWEQDPGGLGERDFQILKEFGSVNAAMGAEADRARAAHMAAITTLKTSTMVGILPTPTARRKGRRGMTEAEVKALSEGVGEVIREAVTTLRDSVDVGLKLRDERIKALEARIADTDSRIVELEATIAAREPV